MFNLFKKKSNDWVITSALEPKLEIQSQDDANSYATKLQNFAGEFEALLSRHLSEQDDEQ